MRRTQLLCFAMAMLALPSIALAGSAAPAVIPDTFTPTSVVQTITVGQSFDVTKTFTIGARDADTPVDIMFLFDTTNSFGPYFTDPTWAATAASLAGSGRHTRSPTNSRQAIDPRNWRQRAWGLAPCDAR